MIRVLLSLLLLLYAGRLFGQDRCEGLARLQLADAQVLSARTYAAAEFLTSEHVAIPAGIVIPAVCRVLALATPTTDSAIHIEVWLPLARWNGKFLQVGNHGLAGSVPQADMVEPLMRGYAVAGTDDGHSGITVDGAWAVGHPEKVRDFGYRAVHLTAVHVKTILHAFYSKSPAQSYFDGCSEGGREALMEAQRYPEDFQGIIAGAPALSFSRLAFRFEWNGRVLQQVPDGLPVTALVLLQTAAVKQCDAQDGVTDGIIGNPLTCHFDPIILQCNGPRTNGCLTTAQVQAARAIYGPVRSARSGTLIAPGFNPGEEGDPDTWSAWITGPPGGKSLNAAFAEGILKGIVFEDAAWKTSDLNFDSDVELVARKLGETLDADSPALARFRSLGGKLIQYHGWGDAAIPPEMSLEYFHAVQVGNRNSSTFYRLLMVPGMSHCIGGRGANVFGNGLYAKRPDPTNDLLLALDRWVRRGIAPAAMIAESATPTTDSSRTATRRLCAYPKEPRYSGRGDIQNAANFSCQAP
jgi:feruloyl esterase